ncbi:hypothetical protein EON66_09955, partial [archaeon]
MGAETGQAVHATMADATEGSGHAAGVDEEALCLGLVREFLYRRGWTSVLHIFDEETVRTGNAAQVCASTRCPQYATLLPHSHSRLRALHCAPGQHDVLQSAKTRAVNNTAELVSQLHCISLYKQNMTRGVWMRAYHGACGAHSGLCWSCACSHHSSLQRACVLWCAGDKLPSVLEVLIHYFACKVEASSGSQDAHHEVAPQLQLHAGVHPPAAPSTAPVARALPQGTVVPLAKGSAPRVGVPPPNLSPPPTATPAAVPAAAALPGSTNAGSVAAPKPGGF